MSIARTGPGTVAHGSIIIVPPPRKRAKPTVTCCNVCQITTMYELWMINTIILFLQIIMVYFCSKLTNHMKLFNRCSLLPRGICYRPPWVRPSVRPSVRLTQAGIVPDRRRIAQTTPLKKGTRFSDGTDLDEVPMRSHQRGAKYRWDRLRKESIRKYKVHGFSTTCVSISVFTFVNPAPRLTNVCCWRRIPTQSASLARPPHS